MRWLIGVACLLVVVLESVAVLGPSAVQSAPQGGRLPIFRKEVGARQPEIVFIGNSILLDSTDENVFTELTGRKALIVGFSGSASAWWYLALKNVLLDPETRRLSGGESRPRLVVVFFRDYGLTDPGFRVTGEYQGGIDGMSTAQEPVLDALAYQGTMSRMDYLLFRRCRLYQRRQNVRQALNSHIRDDVVPFLTGTAGSADEAIARVFTDENLDTELLTIRQLAATSKQAEEAGDFETQLGRSFLPHMIRLARENGVQIAFVRMKRRRDTMPNGEPPALQKYIRDLQAYLTENQAPFLDFTSEPRITLDLYGAGDHLRRTSAVRRHFTSLLAERLAPTLAAALEQGRGTGPHPQSTN